MTTGIIDLLFQSRGAWQVRDYKTDLALESKAYRSRLATHRGALRALGYGAGDAALVPVGRSKIAAGRQPRPADLVSAESLHASRIDPGVES